MSHFNILLKTYFESLELTSFIRICDVAITLVGREINHL